MVQLTTEQRIFIVVNFVRTQSAPAVVDLFQQRFPDRNPPAPSTIMRNVWKYSNHGTSLNRNRGNSGRRRSVRTAENINAVRDVLQEDPHISCRRNPIPMSRTSFNRITKMDIKWHLNECMCGISYCLATLHVDWALPDGLTNVVVDKTF